MGKQTVMPDRLLTDFDRFWAAYPRKTAKGHARKAWQTLEPDAALVGRILDALVWQTRQLDWLRDRGTYIPYPATWLRQERWDDEPVTRPQFGERTLRSLHAIYGDSDVH